MTETTRLELVSPAKLLKSEAVEMVVVPGGEGDFGVLPRHAPMLSTVRPGVLAIYRAGKVTERIFIAGGLAEVDPERCTVLAEEAVELSELSLDAAQARLKDARDALTAAAGDRDEAAARAALAVAEAMVVAASG